MDTPADDRSRTVLTIDDDEKILKFLDIHLASAGYTVIQSTGGNKVFAELDLGAYDIVICDMTMPEVGGMQVVEHLRKISETVQIVMLTGVLDVNMAVEIMRKGAFDYLIKPIRKENLLRVIRMAIDKKELIERNMVLESQNRDYRNFLEKMVDKRTEQLKLAGDKLKDANIELKSLNIQFAQVLAETIEAKDQCTFGHCTRMLHLCSKVGRFINLPEKDMESLEYASLLHDVGKVTVKESILNKPSGLTDGEYAAMKSHALAGEKILRRIKPLQELAKTIGSHHEWYDGTGYPNRLKGDEIPLITRIISVVDTFDAMHADRPYRAGLPLETALEELKKASGTQLDPNIVDAFVDNKLYILDEKVETMRSFMHIP
jgi:putative two-component system response regulator